MDAQTVPKALAEEINRSIYKGVIAVTGGGSGALYELMRYGGASNTILEAIIPYSQQSYIDFTGTKLDKFCSEEGARVLALAAYKRAMELAHVNSIFGVGVSCALAKKGQEREGREHWAFIAVQTRDATVVESIQLRPKDRASEEDLVAKMVLRSINKTCDIRGLNSADSLRYKISASTSIGKRIEPLFNDNPCKIFPYNEAPVKVLFSGSFDPLHRGHKLMAEVASGWYREDVFYELSVTNPDKKSLDYLEAEKRILQFEGKNIVVTNTPTFLEKAAIFPGCKFVVGIDTWNRIRDPKYYSRPIEKVMEDFKLFGIEFLVFGRDIKGVFHHLDLDKTYGIAKGVPQHVFADAASSTEEREKLQADGFARELPKQQRCRL